MFRFVAAVVSFAEALRGVPVCRAHNNLSFSGLSCFHQLSNVVGCCLLRVCIHTDKTPEEEERAGGGVVALTVKNSGSSRQQ